jgi:hypothetical protein
MTDLKTNLHPASEDTCDFSTLVHKPTSLKGRSTPLLNSSVGSHIEAWMFVCVCCFENTDIVFSAVAAISVFVTNGKISVRPDLPLCRPWVSPCWEQYRSVPRICMQERPRVQLCTFYTTVVTVCTTFLNNKQFLNLSIQSIYAIRAILKTNSLIIQMET